MAESIRVELRPTTDRPTAREKRKGAVDRLGRGCRAVRPPFRFFRRIQREAWDQRLDRRALLETRRSLKGWIDLELRTVLKYRCSSISAGLFLQPPSFPFSSSFLFALFLFLSLVSPTLLSRLQPTEQSLAFRSLHCRQRASQKSHPRVTIRRRYTDTLSYTQILRPLSFRYGGSRTRIDSSSF